MSACPEMFGIHALAAYEAGRFDVSATAAKLNGLVAMRTKMMENAGLAQGGEPVDLTEETVELLLDSMVRETTEAEAKAMVDLAALVLSGAIPT